METINSEGLSNNRAIEAREWEQFFNGPIWVLLKRRYEPRLKATTASYEAAESLKDIGQVNGERNILRDILTLPTQITEEFEQEQAALQAERQDEDDSRGAMA